MVRRKFSVPDAKIQIVLETDGTEFDDFGFEELQAVAEAKHILMMLVSDEQWMAPVPVAVLNDISNADTCTTPTTASGNSPAATSSSSYTSPIPSTPCRSLSDCDVFTDKESFQKYLTEHPNTKQHMEKLLYGECVTIKQRQDITRTIVHKLIAVHGNYPTKEKRRKVAGLLGDVLQLDPHIFYDEVTHEGFLVRGLENARRRLAPSDKVHRWVKRSRPLETTQSTSSWSDGAGASAESDGCPRNVDACSLCGGVSNMDNIEKMKNLSNTRILEIRQCLEVTHCIRQNWINTQQPTITQLLDTYPKFCILPELIDLEFSLKYSDTGDFLAVFLSQIVDPLLRYGISGGCGPGITSIAAAAHDKPTEWRVYSACKVASMLLKTSGRRRVSGAEAFERVMVIVPPEKALTEVPRQPYFRLLIQTGDTGGIVSLKISAESHFLEAGSTIVEALDRLFKLFWVFGIEYTPGCENFYRLLQTGVYRLDYGSVPKSIVELLAILGKHCT